jgi:hypothetical protein
MLFLQGKQLRSPRETEKLPGDLKMVTSDKNLFHALSLPGKEVMLKITN